MSKLIMFKKITTVNLSKSHNALIVETIKMFDKKASIKSFTNLELAAKALNDNFTDLLIIKICQYCNTQLVEKLLKFSTLNIFVSDCQSMSYFAIKLKVADYILIQNLEKDILKFIKEIYSTPIIESNYLLISSHSKLEKIPFHQIESITSFSSGYTKILISNSRKIVTTKSLRHFESILPKLFFVRIHRSTIINKHMVSSYNKKSRNITLLSGNNYYVSFRKKKNIDTLK